jgi:hypothetical protein
MILSNTNIVPLYATFQLIRLKDRIFDNKRYKAYLIKQCTTKQIVHKCKSDILGVVIPTLRINEQLNNTFFR